MVISSSIISDASGSLGGAVFYRAPYGLAVRARVEGANPRTARQTTVRTWAAQLNLLWRELTAIERRSWEIGAQEETFYNSLGQPFHPTAQQLFNRRNFNRLKVGYPPLRVYESPIPTPLRGVIGFVLSSASEVFVIITDNETVPVGSRWFVQCTPPQRPGRRGTRLKSYIATLGTDALQFNIWSEYINRYSAPDPGDAVGVFISLVTPNGESFLKARAFVVNE